MLPSVVEGYPCRDAFPPSISSITDILDRSPHCRGHPHRESLVLLVCCVPVSSMVSTNVDSFVNALFLSIVNKDYLLSISSIFSYLMSKMIVFGLIIEIEEISWCTRILAKVSPEKHESSGFVRVPRGFTSCSPVVIVDDGSREPAACHRGRHVTFFAGNSNESRARWVILRAPGINSSRRKVVRSSSRAQPSFLPVFLSFRRYALYGAPVAPACTDHHQMASGDLTRPRATPLRPRNSCHRHPARITLDSEGFQPCAIFTTRWEGFLHAEIIIKGMTYN